MKNIPVRHINAGSNQLNLPGRFSIRKIQDLVAGQKMVEELHRHDFYYILTLEKGKGDHEIDFTTYKVINNSIFFIRPGQVHQLALQNGCTGYLLEFDKGFYKPNNNLSHQRLRRLGNKNFCKANATRFEKLYEILSSIFQEYTERQDGYHEVILSNMEIFFIELARQAMNPYDPSRAANPYSLYKLEELLELMENNITHVKQVSKYAALINLSPYQLNAITKEYLGKTCSDLINEHVILEAKRQLLSTTNQIKDIAYNLGYEDISYFIRFFKKHTGASPETFRNNSR